MKEIHSSNPEHSPKLVARLALVGLFTLSTSCAPEVTPPTASLSDAVRQHIEQTGMPIDMSTTVQSTDLCEPEYLAPHVATMNAAGEQSLLEAVCHQ
jgi:hypothetical protein